MKNFKTLAAVVAGSLVVCGLAIAQGGNASGHDSQHHNDPAALAAHLAEFFPKIAAFDVDKNGKLDDKEKESLRKAIADGTIELPAHTPPNGEKPNVEMMVNHICDVYPQVARYDANHDGVFDETEQAALKSAIEKGEFVFSHGEHSHESGKGQQ
jgi:anti-sigma28 factor (negative regulator of flagellin synthesis)